MKHVMIDLETLGTSSNAVFLSVAAVEFDILEKKIGKEFCFNVSLESALAAGRSISSSTLKWWLEHNPNIMKKMFDSPQDLPNVLFNLSNFIRNNSIIYPWGNSASFDLGLLSNAYSQLNIPTPWMFYNERCYRTIANLLPKDKHLRKNVQEAHDPLYDCKYQINNLFKINEELNLNIQ